ATPLTSETAADVCVIGGGIAGLTTAYLLLQAGKTVCVLEDGEIGSGESGRTSAHLSYALDDRYFEIERLLGPHNAHLAADSHTIAIDTIEWIAEHEDIDCDLRRVDGYLFVPPGEDASVLADELAACHRAGLTRVERVASGPWPTFATGPCLRFPDQAQFHPLKYLNGLAQAILRKGGQIHTRTHATAIHGGRHPRVEVRGGHTVTCSSVVVATNVPINDRVVVQTKLEAHRTYLIALSVECGTVPAALGWDTSDPYHYLRVVDGPREDLLLIGGEDHKVGHEHAEEERYCALERWARERFPAAGATAWRWSGQVVETVDCMAYIGRNPLDRNVYIITGDSGNGLTHGTIGGLLITDLVLGRDNQWEELYRPNRKTLRAAGEYAKHNAGVAGQYASWVTGGEVTEPEQVAPGCGAVIRRGAHKIAVYHDVDGSIHECSAVCPHLHAIVTWNDVEKSWDCPAHGSRFDRFGTVVNGPANHNLVALQPDAAESPQT
ncbi:MAG: FAD-dependent oxidoreductase, partial [Planctomycetes bacterium]|nr:FAD-dependent oxidoreductase [Planctomycetota bacterium]